MPKINSPTELEDLRREILSKRDPNKPCITLCSGTACHATGSEKVAVAIEKELEKQSLKDDVDVRRTGCHGFCERGPIVVIYPEEICYLNVTPEDVSEIISETIKEKKIIDRLLYTDPNTGEKVVYEYEIPFYKEQTRIVFGPNKNIDPKSIDDYIAIGGYSALSKALFDMTPEQVLEEVKRSNLRGRGGGGFPTGRKWETTRNAPGEPKYVIVNCDEGDPGAYMDRSLMEGNFHSVIEGLIIGAYAIGSHEGLIYVRQEYPLAVENVNIAIKRAEGYGLLGNNILGSGFDFTVKVHRGAGAFVSGESSALMTAIEGKVGEPRPKYIHTSESGVWDKPSDLNNVETWANIPLIINKGSEWFTSIGTERSKGTKIFSLVGKVNNTGLVEVPMGTTIREIIYKIGGGIPGGKKFKALQTGGPSGGCISEEYLDTPVDFDELAKLGSIMGSGGMIVMDEDTCMVDVARYFVDFLCDESCGKCVPCREGLKRVRKILNGIVAGEGKEGDIELLEEIGNVMSKASLCALGKTAANPILSTIRYFRDEYDAHIEEKRCPALVCKDLISYYIDPERCNACRLCLKNCPADAIDGEKKLIHIIDQSKCIKCGTCFDVCPPKFSAVKKISGAPVPPPIPEEKRVLVKDKKAKGGKK
ncbi:MAG: NADH dehydrogenase I subunit F [Candidatus Methanolliviera sp. GoM_asphalt]|nr:MAG: NADH dehydrogenase I subunit F [Candidatus Methanolliviera sp. GoM_asphalt]